MRTVGPKKIAVGDLGEFWYGDYKEPFEELEGAVPGHPRGAVLKDDDGKILCAYCGKTFDYLPRHITSAHGMRTSEYKREVGLLQKSALVSERVRRNRVRTALRNRHAGTFLDRPPSKGARGTRKQVPEELNRTGRCYAQILAVARQIAQETGTVTYKALARRGIWQRNVEVMFGSMSSLRRLVGDGRRHRGNPWTEAELITGLRSLADQLGRTPVSSDLRRYGLPSLMAYMRHFGSYVAACERAGLPPYQWVPRDPRSEAAMLLAWATTGTIKKASAAVGHGDRAIRETLTKYGIPELPPGRGRHTDRQAARAFAAEVAGRLEGGSEPSKAA